MDTNEPCLLYIVHSTLYSMFIISFDLHSDEKVHKYDCFYSIEEASEAPKVSL